MKKFVSTMVVAGALALPAAAPAFSGIAIYCGYSPPLLLPNCVEIEF